MKTLKASEEFAVGKNDIAWVGSNFKENLYDLTLTKGDTKGIETRKLTRWMNDTEITAEMNPEPLTLGDVLAFLKTADRSLWYIFRVVDAKGELWDVNVDWRADYGGWHVGACSVAGPGSWSAGGRVVSRRFFDSKPCHTPSVEGEEVLICDGMETGTIGFVGGRKGTSVAVCIEDKNRHNCEGLCPNGGTFEPEYALLHITKENKQAVDLLVSHLRITESSPVVEGEWEKELLELKRKIGIDSWQQMEIHKLITTLLHTEREKGREERNDETSREASTARELGRAEERDRVVKMIDGEIKKALTEHESCEEYVDCGCHDKEEALSDLRDKLTNNV